MNIIKNAKGITLTVLVGYIFLSLIALSILGALITHFRNNFNDMDEKTVQDLQFDKVNYQLLNETRDSNSYFKMGESNSTTLVFMHGSETHTYTYSSEDKALYYNEYTKIAENIDECSFEYESENGVKYIILSITINGKHRVTKYAITRI